MGAEASSAGQGTCWPPLPTFPIDPEQRMAVTGTWGDLCLQTLQLHKTFLVHQWFALLGWELKSANPPQWKKNVKHNDPIIKRPLPFTVWFFLPTEIGYNRVYTIACRTWAKSGPPWLAPSGSPPHCLPVPPQVQLLFTTDHHSLPIGAAVRDCQYLQKRRQI